MGEEKIVKAQDTAVPQDAAPEAPKRFNQAEALALAVQAHDLVDKALAKAQALIADGSHDELASARGSLATLKAQLDANWPGGKRQVDPGSTS